MQLEGVYEAVLRKGMEQGIEKGIEQGIEQGIEKGMEEGILLVLRTRGLVVSPAHQARITACTDLALARRWLQRAVVARSTDEVFEEG